MSSYFDEASLVMIPSGYKDQKVYSVKPLDGSGDLTFTRASNATRVASNGLIEKVRTNLALYSEDATNAAYAKTNATVTGNTIAAPDGTLTADTITATSANGQVQGIVTITSGLVYTVSVWLKRKTGTGTVQLRGVSNTSTTVTITNDWARYSVSLTASDTNGRYGVLLQTSGDEVYCWGFQLETGDIATDYIATTTAVSVGPVSGLPRLDYLNSTCPRLILEPQRSNLLLFSEQIDNAAWTKTLLTAGANLAVSPDGYTNADKMQEIEGVVGNKQISRSFSQTAGAKSYSVFVKKDERSEFLIVTNGGGLAADITGFNLITKTVTQGSGSIVDYGNDWFRCTQFFTTTDNTSVTIRIRLLASGGSSYTGVGGYGLFVWGNQVEAGAYATSYIPTLGTSVTRVADAASKTGISSLIGQTEGTIYAEWTATNANTSGRILAISDGGFTNRIAILEDSATIRLFISASSVVQADLTNLGSYTGTHKIAVAYQVCTKKSTKVAVDILWADKPLTTSFASYVVWPAPCGIHVFAGWEQAYAEEYCKANPEAAYCQPPTPIEE
jgi:hypothetical protein